jgi:dTDP-4-dehydrorhamnose reductase
MQVLVLGATGMLGHVVFRFMSSAGHHVSGTVRSTHPPVKTASTGTAEARYITGIDVLNTDQLTQVMRNVKPDIVINCVGLIKQHSDGADTVQALMINAVYPNQLAKICDAFSARLIHISTDCVFTGKTGNYKETDIADARDVYGLSKFLGEIHTSNAITLRTSIIGPEQQTNRGLLEWFLSQEDHCKGYTNAIFSGVPTIILSEIIEQEILTRPALTGLFHIASEPISKHLLLGKIAHVYNKSIQIEPDDKLKIDRSLNAQKFEAATGYRTPDWTYMLQRMEQEDS